MVLVIAPYAVMTLVQLNEGRKRAESARARPLMRVISHVERSLEFDMRHMLPEHREFSHGPVKYAGITDGILELWGVEDNLMQVNNYFFDPKAIFVVPVEGAVEKAL